MLPENLISEQICEDIDFPKLQQTCMKMKMKMTWGQFWSVYKVVTKIGCATWNSDLKSYLIFTFQVITALGQFMNVQCMAGGTNFRGDMKKLDYGQHVLCGTPHFVLDMIRQNRLRTWCIKMLILDEADEMLNKGFKDQIYDVYRSLPHRSIQGLY